MASKRAVGTISLFLASLVVAASAPKAWRPTPAGSPASEIPRVLHVQGQVLGPGQVLIEPQPSGPIAERAAWARGQAKANRWERGFWLGFGIRRLMGEHSSMGWFPWGRPGAHVTLDDIINGGKTPIEKKVADDQAARGTAASMPGAAAAFAARERGDEPERPVMKEIGLLFRFKGGEKDFPADIRVSNLNLPFDFEELPFIWVGMVTDAESLAYLMPLYGAAGALDDKRSLLWAIGLHRDPAVVVPFIERILAGKEKEEIRAEAVACLGEQNDPKALDLVLRTIKADPSEEVREHAVEALVELEIPAAAVALISLAQNGPGQRLRGEAVRGLAARADAASVKALEMIAGADKDPEVQKEAIHALADLPKRSGLAYLVTLVRTKSDATVRKEAVEAIGEVGGADAVKFLAQLARGR